MQTGLLYALGFAVAIIVLALGLTRLTRGKSRPAPNDPNGSDRDGKASATWIAINRATDESSQDR